MLDVRIHGQEEIRRVAAALRRADRTDLRKAMAREIRTAGRVVVDDVRTVVRTLPIRGFPFPGRKRAFSAARWSPSHQLREQVAAGVSLQLALSETDPRVRFRASGSKVPGESGANMPRRLDDAAGWRHPVLGNRQVWVKQQGKPWFAATIYRRRREFERRLGQALEDTRRAIETA